MRRPLCVCPSCSRFTMHDVDGLSVLDVSEARRLEQNNLDALRLLCSDRDVGQLARATPEIRLRVFASVGRSVEGVRR